MKLKEKWNSLSKEEKGIAIAATVGTVLATVGSIILITGKNDSGTKLLSANSDSDVATTKYGGAFYDKNFDEVVGIIEIPCSDFPKGADDVWGTFIENAASELGDAMEIACIGKEAIDNWNKNQKNK